MQANFDKALSSVLKHEGGYVNNPHDPGGPTNYGITQTTYNAWRSKNNKLPLLNVKDITLAEVAQIYKQEYWDAIAGDLLPSGIDYALFDFAVNSGVARALNTYKTCKTVDSICDARLSFLNGLSLWSMFGAGWANRVATVRAAAKAFGASTTAIPAPETPATTPPPAPQDAPQTQTPAPAPATPSPAPKPSAAHSKDLFGPILEKVSNWLKSIFTPKSTSSPSISGAKNMLNGLKTIIVSLLTLGTLGGVGLTGGWAAVANLAPAVIAIVVPILAMTLHNAIKNFNLQTEAAVVEKLLAELRTYGLGPISGAAGAVDDLIKKAQALDNPAPAATPATPAATPAPAATPPATPAA